VKAGDIVVLAFSLDTDDRIPEIYEDILPKPWAEIEARLKKGQSVELMGEARDFKIILFAAPKREQLQELIRKSSLFDSARKPRTPASDTAEGDEAENKKNQ
jgi:hypothetical protein